MSDYDLLIRGGQVVNAPGGPQGALDLGIVGDQIVTVEPDLARNRARRVIDARGALVLPGLVDAHVHVSGRFGRSIGLRMLIRAGVTTALDLAGEPASLANGLHAAGCGVTAGVVVPVVPDDTVAGHDPENGEIDALLEHALEQGAIGLKVLGGHYPITPSAVARVIDRCARRGAYCAVHAGSTETGSDIRGLEELIRLAGEHPVHVAHVNSYCRGQVEHPVSEAARAVTALCDSGANIRSESYLAVHNGADASCREGQPVSDVVKTCLRLGGYKPTAAGLRAAIEDGWARVHGETADGVVFVEPARGAELFSEHASHVGVSFPVNAPGAALALALARDGARFVIDALASDGGSFPRNTTLVQGLALVAAGVLDLPALVLKACVTPAGWLKLPRKGRLACGMDADVVVAREGRAEMVVAAGRVAVEDDDVAALPGRMLSTPAGYAAMVAAGVEYTTLEVGW